MPPLTHYNHKDTIMYLPKHHKTKGLTQTLIDVFKALEKRYVHEGRTIDSSFLEGTNLLEPYFYYLFKSRSFNVIGCLGLYVYLMLRLMKQAHGP